MWRGDEGGDQTKSAHEEEEEEGKEEDWRPTITSTPPPRLKWEMINQILVRLYEREIIE